MIAVAIKSSGERQMKAVAAFHEKQLKKCRWPLAIEDFKSVDRKNRLFATKEGVIFFGVDEKTKAANRVISRIRNLTMISKTRHNLLDKTRNILARFGDEVLIMAESYNAPVEGLLKSCRSKETRHWQKKLVSALKTIRVKPAGVGSGIRIRTIDPRFDIQRYADYYNKALGFLGTIVDRHFVDEIVSRSSFDASGYFLAEEKDSIVGFCALEKEPWGRKGSRFGYIYQIGVDEMYRGTGLADLLLSRVARYAEEKGIKTIGVGVSGFNAAAVSFFLKRNFSLAYEIKGVIADTSAEKA